MLVALCIFQSMYSHLISIEFYLDRLVSSSYFYFSVYDVSKQQLSNTYNYISYTKDKKIYLARVIGKIEYNHFYGVILLIY